MNNINKKSQMIQTRESCSKFMRHPVVHPHAHFQFVGVRIFMNMIFVYSSLFSRLLCHLRFSIYKTYQQYCLLKRAQRYAHSSQCRPTSTINIIKEITKLLIDSKNRPTTLRTRPGGSLNSLGSNFIFSWSKVRLRVIIWSNRKMKQHNT